VKKIPRPSRFGILIRHAIWLAALLAAVLQCASCGGGFGSTATASSPTPAPVPPPPPQASGTTLPNLHQSGGWASFALLPKGYQICQSCQPTGPEASWQMAQGVDTPSMSGNAARFDIGGQTHFADILWNNHLIGSLSSQGVKDPDGTLVPSLHDFTYDVYFYGTNLAVSQALEFDINQFFNQEGFIWGHECRIAGGHEWDTWDNVNKHWVATGVPCNPVSNSWNHVILKVHRTSNDQLVFESITLNGVTSNLNISRPHGTASAGWHGVTINYQMDGNVTQQPYSIYLDQLNFTYQ
jgi:hypothetical protein